MSYVTGSVPRTVAQKLSEQPSILDFGGAGDGATDNAAAIAAVLALPADTRVHWPEGVYCTSAPIVAAHKINWWGHGRKTRIRYIGAPTTDFVYLDYTIPPSTGAVNTSGTAVAWVSGDKFQTSWLAGYAIVINGAGYSLAAPPSDDTHLTLTASAGTQSAVAYSKIYAQNGAPPHIERILFDGNGLAANGIHTVLSVGGLYRNVEVRNVTDTAFLAEGSTFDVFDSLTVSGQIESEAFTTVPTCGLRIYGNAGGPLILNARLEKINGVGLQLDLCYKPHVIGGASEGNVTGVVCGTGCDQGVFTGFDCEANSGMDYEINSASGFYGSNTFTNCTGSSSSGGVHVIRGFFNQFFGGQYHGILLDSTAYETAFYGAIYGAGGYTNNGVHTICTTLWDGVNAVAVPDTPNGVASTGALSGTDLSLSGRATLRKDSAATPPLVSIDNRDAAGMSALYLTWDGVVSHFAGLQFFNPAYSIAALQNRLRLNNTEGALDLNYGGQPVIVGNPAGATVPAGSKFAVFGAQPYFRSDVAAGSASLTLDNRDTSGVAALFLTEDGASVKAGYVYKYGSTHATKPGKMEIGSFGGSNVIDIIGTLQQGGVAAVVTTDARLSDARTPTAHSHTTGLPVYANNAAAVTGGLAAGQLYRTGADPDPVCVVH